jgi:Iap family predicted aminopeptidase
MVVTKSTAENRNRIETRDVMLKSINMRRRVKYTVSGDTTSLDTYGTCRSKTKTKNYSSIFEAVPSLLYSVVAITVRYCSVRCPLNFFRFANKIKIQNRPFSKPEKTFALTQYTVHRTVDITKWNTALGVG